MERGLVETRSRAQALLLAGRVRVGAGDAGRFDRKPGDLVDGAMAVEVATPLPYVSRGGEKLAGALDAFGVNPAGLVCLDAGASTGGFTDVLLKRGAARVHAVDVGRGQLAVSLAGDPRVIETIEYPRLHSHLFQLDAVVSRKKQLLPHLARHLAKLEKSA